MPLRLIGFLISIAVFGLCASGRSMPLSADETKQPNGRFVTVEFLYATNRAPLGVTGPREGYTSKRTRRLVLGTANVTVPVNHKIGELELAPVSILEKRLRMPRRPRDLGRHFGIAKVLPLATDQFERKVAGTVAKKDSEKDKLLLFIPGRASFNDAAYRTAQLAYDLNYKGKVILFSWPSSSSPNSYNLDRSNAAFSAETFVPLLLELTTQRPEMLDVIAVGMGADFLIRAMVHLKAKAKQSNMPLLRYIFFVAPDIGEARFRADSTMLLKLAHRMTVYTSVRDMGPRVFNPGRGVRLGSPQDRPIPGVDVINLTDAKQSLVDMFDALRGLPPKDRSNLIQNENGLWTISRTLDTQP